MNCVDVRRLLGPYCDGELDLMQHVSIEEHLRDCAVCTEQAENLRSLRAAFASPALYHRAPASLRTNVLAGLETGPSAGREQFGQRATGNDFDGDGVANESRLRVPMTQRAKRWTLSQLAAIAAGIMLLAGTSATVGVLASRSRISADDQLAEWIAADHIRSLQVEHLMDVASSDRHTVKPWFKGKVDFSPQTPDLSAEGFELTGGRLDYLQDRPVAALVYARRKHTINLFTWPAASDIAKDARSIARRGFHLRHWQRGGMEFWAISDVNDDELDEFVRLYQERSSEGGK